ncbi:MULTISPECIES: hypothetical protein [Dyadobacter]|uniref:Uncharacterized protein n=1 Tax=Dyadobacter chenhuakuii TaxID=2909339 RepID=A0A9X1TVU6_9BACT|nr:MULTISPECIES: hypothetical protein [Dyadobacter]MCF2500437.1 hypothetical protein [Dyadobacter chenhuakuii]MCF2516022.1 hypothetical protein [Dyadobacter sp. CY351]
MRALEVFYLDTKKSITYNKNDNITNLIRAGAAVDKLTYTYLGNRLSSVTDGSGNNLIVKNGGKQLQQAIQQRKKYPLPRVTFSKFTVSIK